MAIRFNFGESQSGIPGLITRKRLMWRAHSLDALLIQIDVITTSATGPLAFACVQ